MAEPAAALYVPASDASGEVVELGEDVTRFKVGERVTPIYTQGWHDGQPTLELRTQRTLGAPLTGVLQDYVVVPAEDAVRVPEHLTHDEAATLPIAALTAWSTLAEGGVKSGDVVLIQGTGGGGAVARCNSRSSRGARVIALSSSDEKAGACAVDGRGGDDQLSHGTRLACRRESSHAGPRRRHHRGDGRIDAVPVAKCAGVRRLHRRVGFVAGMDATIPVRQLIGPMVRVQGIAVGSRARFER
jgi:hypothetical protein